ncbi:MAG TPA: glycoside hydrolase family 2 TIM barrel-domain containing protein [Albitalea sp.]|nr:glycoside hydrolase family 2 TIM barrel-domain containing protein [Albitalea sp.]
MAGAVNRMARSGRWLALLLLILCVQAQAATRTSLALDGPWRFQRADVAGAEGPAFDDGDWSQVMLPHTYNAVDGEAGGAYYRGPAWYRLVIESATPRVDGRCRFLEFDGAALAADVWVNGRHAGRHEGGYARFRFDVTNLLTAGRNTLAVRVDNATLPSVAPLGGDFTVFGGLYRRVRLVETAPVHVDMLDHGGPGVAVDVAEQSPAGARLRVRVSLRNDMPSTRRLALRLTLRDAEGHAVAHAEQALRVRAGSTAAAEVPLHVERPRLWQGVLDPYLYRLRAEVLQAGAVVDELSLPVGIRTIALDPAHGLLLNGQPYALHGVNYFHAGRPGKGLAVGDAEVEEDMRILKELGVTGLRLVHFQHPQRAYELADELGFVLWTEIPLNSALQDTPAFRDNLSQQLRELQQQNRQHPSVAIWGLGNEVYRADAIIRALLASLHAQAKRDDPHRVTAYAHCCAADDDPMALQTDLTGYNRYWGWYDGQLSDLGPWADALHARLPARVVAISEYGAGASVQHQQEPPQRPRPDGHWHPEQYQALFHEAYWRQIAARPWLAGSFVWVGFDLASAGRNEGDRAGVNDKGLVTYDRRVRKDAYYLYQAHWRSVPMAHIASGRLTPRPAGATPVKVYSNAVRVTLQVDGVTLGTVPVVDRMAVWPTVALPAGRHVLMVSADNGAIDTVEWQCIEASDSLATRPRPSSTP